MNSDISLPQDITTEKSVLGSMIYSRDCLQDGLMLLTEDCFYSTANKKVFSCMDLMQKEDIPVDFITLVSKLRETGSFDAVGGEPYIAELVNDVASSENISYHAQILVDKRNRRKAIETAYRLNQAAYDEEGDFTEKSEQILSENSMMGNDRNARVVRVSDLRGGMVEYYDRKQIKRTYNSGWKNFNRHYRLSTGSLNIWTGIPGSGKSEIFDAVMINAAINHNWRWLVFSPENYPYEIHVQKLAEKICKKGMFSKEGRMQPQELDEAINFLQEHFLFIDSSDCEFTTDGILNFVKRNTSTAGFVQGVLIDPFNELEIVKIKNENNTDAIGRFLRRARWVARKNDFSLHVIAHPTKLEKDRKTHKYPVARPYDIDGCYDANTEVLTFNGWKSHARITTKDRVCCFDAEKNILEYHYPVKVWRKKYCGNMVKIRGKAFDSLVTPDHSLYVKAAWGTTKSFKKKYVGSGLGRPQIYKEGWAKISAKNIRSCLLLPWSTNLKDVEEYEISDEKLKFIGFWIAEGDCDTSVSLCQAKGETQIEFDEEVVKKIGYKFSRRETHRLRAEKPMVRWRLLIRYDKEANEFAKMIMRDFGKKCWNKRLPYWINKLSIRQKNILLEWYLKGDGQKKGNNNYSATTVSCMLANDLQRLCIEIGRMTSIQTKPSREEKRRTTYILNIGRNNRKTIALRRDRHVSEQYYNGKVYCLTVPTGAYVTRRNGKVAILGNSAHWFNKSDNCFSIYREYKSNIVQLHIQKIKFKWQGYPGVIQLQYDPASGCLTEYHDEDTPEGSGGTDLCAESEEDAGVW